MTSLTAFARGRDVDPKTVSIYMKRHDMSYDKEKGLTDEQIKILDKVYPVPKPVIIVDGLSAEEERKLRKALEEALKRLATAQDRIVELTEKVSAIQLLEDKANQQEKEIQILKSRTLWERIINRY